MANTDHCVKRTVQSLCLKVVFIGAYMSADDKDKQPSKDNEKEKNPAQTATTGVSTAAVSPAATVSAPSVAVTPTAPPGAMLLPMMGGGMMVNTPNGPMMMLPPAMWNGMAPQQPAPQPTTPPKSKEKDKRSKRKNKNQSSDSESDSSSSEEEESLTPNTTTNINFMKAIKGLMEAGADDDLIKMAMKGMIKYWKKTDRVKEDSERREAVAKMKKQLKKKLKTDANAVEVIDDIEAGKRKKKSDVKCDHCGFRGHSSDTCWRKNPGRAPQGWQEKRKSNPPDAAASASSSSSSSSAPASGQPVQWSPYSVIGNYLPPSQSALQQFAATAAFAPQQTASFMPFRSIRCEYCKKDGHDISRCRLLVSPHIPTLPPNSLYPPLPFQ